MLKKLVVCLAVVGASEAGYAVAQSEEIPEVPAACAVVKDIPGSIIVKFCAGSGHLKGDSRGSGAAFIGKRGSKVKVKKCIPIIAEPTAENPDGKVIGKMYQYPFNLTSAYAFRHYSNYVNGCGRGETRAKIRKRAAGGAVFVNYRGNACYRLPKFYMNVNSSQNCQ